MTQHTDNSSYREKLIEHLFIAELLKPSWLKHKCAVEVAKPEVDNSGYDVIMESAGVIRHIQLKASVIGSTTASQKVHTKLQDKRSGCVVWIYFDENSMKLGPFRYFGGKPGEPLPDIGGRKIAKHTKGNKDGVKAERQNIRVVPKGQFECVKTVEDIYAKLFGPAKKNAQMKCESPKNSLLDS